MPKNRELTLAARAYQTFVDHPLKYTQAREKIVALSAASGETYADLRLYFSDHGNKILCTDCGWRTKSQCPQCGGCGCATDCEDYRHDDARVELRNDDGDSDCGYGEDDCPECGESVFECRCEAKNDCRNCGGHEIYGCVCDDTPKPRAQPEPDIDDYDRGYYVEQDPDDYRDDEPEPDDYVLPDEPPDDYAP